MNKTLIVTTRAAEFAAEIGRLTDGSIPVTACATAAEARDAYSDETVLFGSPGMIVEILPSMPTVEWVQSSWAGVTPLIELDRRDYLLTGIKDVFGPQMAEYVIGYLLAHELRVLERAEAQRAHRWGRTLSGTLGGKRLGIMGTGSIGRHIAAAARCLGLEVSGLSRSGAAVEAFDAVFANRDLGTFLTGLDYLVSALPQTPDTDDLLNAESLTWLPAHACFVNVGRGNVVDDRALADALESGRLAAAVLDVFDEEPLPPGHVFWDTPNLTVTPHIAAVSHPLLIVPIFVDNYRRFVDGRPLRYVVDFDRGY